MMETKNKLVDLGFTELQAAIYEHLLKHNVCTATEIAAAVNTSRTRTYQVLDELLAINACTEIRGSIKKYRATDPETVILNLQQTLQQKQLFLDELSPVLRNLYHSNRDKNVPQDFISVLYSRSAVLQRIAALEDATQSTILAFNKPPYFMNNNSDPQQIEPRLRQPEQQALKRRVEIRSLYEVEPGIEDFVSKVVGFSQAGEKVRVIDSLPFKLIIFDFKTVVIALYNQQLRGNNFVTLIIDHEEFASSMATVFDIFWLRGKSVK